MDSNNENIQPLTWEEASNHFIGALPNGETRYFFWGGLVNREYDPPLDPGIAQGVEILNAAGVETYESCEGGSGHAYLEPAIRFHGGHDEGFRALAIALQHRLPVWELRRVWMIVDGEPTGPKWELAFYKKLKDLKG